MDCAMTDGLGGVPKEAESADVGDDEELTSPLVAFCQRVNRLDDVGHTFEDAMTSVGGMAFLVLPLVAWLLDWHGFWGSLGFGLGFPAVWLVILGLVEILPKPMRQHWPPLLFLGLSPLPVFGWWLSVNYQPSYVGPAIAIVAAVSLLTMVVVKGRDKREDKERLRAAPVLVKECGELATEGLNVDVYDLLEQAVEDRQASLGALRDSLDNDLGINGHAVLNDLDAALAELMNRAKPVSDLLNRAKKASNDAIAEQAEGSYAAFQELAGRLHRLAVSLLKCASAPEAEVLTQVRARVEDLSALEDAQREVNAL